DRLGVTIGGLVIMDLNGAQRGWYVDPTPAVNEEFTQAGNPEELVATAASPAYGRIDLLTVVMHELGHVLGLEDHDAALGTHDLMDATLATGARRLVAEAAPPIAAPAAPPIVAHVSPPTAATVDAFQSVAAPAVSQPTPVLVFDEVAGTLQ